MCSLQLFLSAAAAVAAKNELESTGTGDIFIFLRFSRKIGLILIKFLHSKQT
jgi:hypothetical protein